MRQTVPMPTLYNTEGVRSKKLSIIELVLYNIASILGGVAAGYDVRMSNVSPLHPRLQPYRAESQGEGQYRTGSEGSAHFGPDYEFHTTSGYMHNTYHGPAKHYRPLLNTIAANQISNIQTVDQKPMRFTDSPQHYSNLSNLPPNMASTSSGFVGQTLSNTSGLGSNYTTNTSGMSSNLSTASGLGTTVSSTHHGTQPPTPSPRRKSSSTSNEGDLYVNYRENFSNSDRVPGIYLAADYHQQPQTDYPDSNGPQYVGHFTARGEMYRNEHLSRHPPPYAYERTNEYIAKHRNVETYPYVVYNEFGQNLQHNYDKPNYDMYHTEYGPEYVHPYHENQGAAHNNRTPVRVPYNTHRRTNSNTSNASSTNTSSSNVNQGFRMEGEDSGTTVYPGQFYRRSQSSDKYLPAQKTPEKREYEYSHTSHTREYYPRQNSQENTSQERPGTLGLELGMPTKLRSSLKKYNQSKKSGSGSGGGTPTNPTPPDSLTSEDSSYVSAKDSSGSGSRVRFSPETLVETGVPPAHQQLQERRPSRHS